MIWNPDCQGPCDCPGKEWPEPACCTCKKESGSLASGRVHWVNITRDAACPQHGDQPCPTHQPVQHRDRKRPWCRACGRAADGELIGVPRG